MKLLENYILRRVGRLTLTALMPVLAIIWIVQALGNIDLVTDSGQSISSFMILATLILPTIIPAVLPFAVVIGITQTLTAMNNDSELTVIDASGASRSVILRPIVYFAVIMSILSFLIHNIVEPQVRASARLMVASAYADLLSAVIEEKTFRKIEDGLYVQIDKRLKGRMLQGLFIADTRKPDSQLLYYAREGAIDAKGTSLIMHDGEVHRRSNDGHVSIIKFQSYTFDLSELTQSRGTPSLRAIDRDLPFLFDPDPKDPVYSQLPNEFTAELHRRLTDWTLPLLYALVGVVFAGDARSHRQARTHPMVTALGVAFTHRWAAFYLSYQIERSPDYAVFLYALYVATFAIMISLLAGPKMRQRMAKLFLPFELLLTWLGARLSARSSNRTARPGGQP